MPKYSVTIHLAGRDPFRVVSKLRRAFGDTVAKTAKITVSGHPNVSEDPCRRRGHFGCVHWTDDDVEGRFQELDVEVTPKLLKEVKDRIRHIDDGMTELGWEVIESAISDAVDAASTT